MIRLCGLLLLRGAAWAAYTVGLMTIVGIAVRTWNCWGDTCPPPSSLPVVPLLVVIAIIGALAMLWAGSLARRWLELRPGRRWLATGAFYSLLTLPLVTAATFVTLEVVDMLRDAEKAVITSRVWEMDSRVSKVESDVRALVIDRGGREAHEKQVSPGTPPKEKIDRHLRMNDRAEAVEASPQSSSDACRGYRPSVSHAFFAVMVGPAHSCYEPPEVEQAWVQVGLKCDELMRTSSVAAVIAQWPKCKEWLER